MGGLSFPRKPWAYGDRVSHPVYRYSCLHKLLSWPVLVLVGLACISMRVLLYHYFSVVRVFGAELSPVIFSAQTRLTSELLRFL